MSTKKNVVIVGGGHAGFTAARDLSAKLDASRYTLTLVTLRSYHIHRIASARLVATAEGKLEETALVPYDRLFHNGNGTVKVGKVVAISEPAPGKGGEVVLESGERVPYAALVLATGNAWYGALEFPEKEEEVRPHIDAWRKKYEAAQHVVVVGGGAVGIEIAGEVKEAFPKKKVTVIHSEALLLNDAYPDKWRKDIEKRTRAFGIDVILGDSVSHIPEAGTVGVTTNKGKSIADADLVVQAFGSRPNAAYVSTLDAKALNERGFVKVEPSLQVVGHPGVFAVGDLIDWKEQKQAAKANTHAAVAAANVVSFLNGAAPAKVYKGSIEMIIIPLGKSGGSGYVGALWGITVGGTLAKALKGKTLMVDMIRKQMGY